MWDTHGNPPESLLQYIRESFRPTIIFAMWESWMVSVKLPDSTMLAF